MDSIALWAFLSICLGFSDGAKTEYNKRLKVATLIHEPMVMYAGSDKQRFIGFLPDLLEKLGAVTNASFYINKVEERHYGPDRKMKSWIDMLADIYTNKSDVAATSLSVMTENTAHSHVSYPILDTGYVIVMKRPSGELHAGIVKGLFSFFQPFSVDTWVAVVLAYIFASSLYGIILHYDPVEEFGKQSLLKNMQCGFPIMFYRFCFQGSLAPTACTSRAARILLSFWSVFIILIFALYITSLEVFLERGKEGKVNMPITSFKDLSMQTEIKYGTVASGPTEDYFSNAVDEVDIAIGQHFKQFPDQLVESFDDGIERVRSDENYALVMEEASARHFANKSPCNLVFIKHSFIRNSYGFACANTTICRFINIAIYKLLKSGEIQALRDKWFSNGCDTELDGNQYVNAKENKKSASDVLFRPYSLSMDTVGGVFIFLGVGLLLSVVILVCEICFAKRIAKRINSENTEFEAITEDME